VIQEHAVAVALEMRETGRTDDDLLDRLATDERLDLSRADLETALANPLDLAGIAGQQVATVVTEVDKIAAKHPEAAAYRPGPVI
jgi:adenylosuccinate lyase